MIKPSASDLGYDLLGTVAKVHGVKGEVAIQTDLPDPQQLRRLELVHINDGRGLVQPFRIESVRISTHGKRQLFFVILETVSDRNAAQALVGREVMISPGLIDFFDEDDDDLAGYAVLDTEGATIGEVLEVVENPAHPILRVRIDGHGETLIPFVDVYVEEVDDDGRTVTVADIEGLLEL